MPYGRRTGHGHEEAAGEQVQGGVRQVADAANAILDGRGECAAMPHADTLRIMELMDSIRAAWGLSYPFE